MGEMFQKFLQFISGGAIQVKEWVTGLHGLLTIFAVDHPKITGAFLEMIIVGIIGYAIFCYIWSMVIITMPGNEPILKRVPRTRRMLLFTTLFSLVFMFACFVKCKGRL